MDNKKKTAGSPTDIQLGFSIIHRHGRIMNDRAVKHFRLSGQQMGYLKYIADHKGTSQEELAKAMRIDKGAIAKAVKDMCAKGYVYREPNPHDRRAYCLFPTEKSKQISECGEKHYEEFHKRLTEGMSDEEVEQFKVLLGKITDNMAKIMERGNDI